MAQERIDLEKKLMNFKEETNEQNFKAFSNIQNLKEQVEKADAKTNKEVEA